MRILVINRGEIALRIIRSIKKMNHEAVVIYSEVDRDALHVKHADIAVCVGKATAKESYLNIPNILSIITELGIDLVHPGYGFLSENANFVQLCEQLDCQFIGPSAEVIDLMGDKINAINTVKAVNVPTIAESVDPIKNEEHAREIATKTGYPIMIKAAGGGGGKGLRIVREPEELISNYHQVISEAKITDPNPRVFIERFIEDAKHIEVQVMGDMHGNALHFGTRDCSMQRNNQKVIEEAPALINQDLIDRMCKSAVDITKKINYVGAGTIEFLVKGDQYYFLEMNTRLQVEHPVTEMVCGVDLVELQIKIACEEELELKQSDINTNNHAIEMRINAENPSFNFSPHPGTITKLTTPGGENVRNEFGVTSGSMISPYYDSMIGKIIVTGKDRQEAIKEAKAKIAECDVEGIATNIEFIKVLLNEEQYEDNSYTTTFIAQNIDSLIDKIKE